MKITFSLEHNPSKDLKQQKLLSLFEGFAFASGMFFVGFAYNINHPTSPSVLYVCLLARVCNP